MVKNAAMTILMNNYYVKSYCNVCIIPKFNESVFHFKLFINCITMGVVRVLLINWDV